MNTLKLSKIVKNIPNNLQYMNYINSVKLPKTYNFIVFQLKKVN